MIKLEKSLPMAYIFYGQDSLVEENTRYDEIGIFLPDSLFLKNLERHVKKLRRSFMQKNNYTDIMEKNHVNPLARLHGKRQQCSDQ